MGVFECIMYAHLCACACVCGGGWGICLVSFLSNIVLGSHYLWNKASHWPGDQPLGLVAWPLISSILLISTFLYKDYRCTVENLVSFFNMCVGDSNSGLHECKANTFLTEPRQKHTFKNCILSDTEKNLHIIFVTLKYVKHYVWFIITYTKTWFKQNVSHLLFNYIWQEKSCLILIVMFCFLKNYSKI